MKVGGGSAENDYYLGSIFHSLEHLPQWYQVFSIFGVFFIFSFREIAVVGWLAASLHQSFGTEIVWSEEYQRLLEQMSFNERVCFTLYGVALFLIAFVAYRVFGRDAIYIGMQESGISGGRKWWPTAIVCTIIGCEGIVILKEVVTSTLSDHTSLARLALDEFKGIEEMGFDPRLANGNPHFIIQLEILKSLMISFLERVGPAVFLACFYRLMRDVPRKAHAALRWYIATLLISRSLVALYIMYRTNDWERKSFWILFISALSFLGILNYTFGPSKRGGWTATTSFVASIYQTIQGIIKCTAIFSVIYIAVLALVVSVHVVELLLIWLIFFLTTIWIPAIIDSFSTDYIFSITTAICFISREMNYLTDWGSFRLWCLLTVYWMNLCFFYNFTTNAFKSRYGGIFAISILFIGIWRTLGSFEGSNDFVSFLENSAAKLREIVEGILNNEENISPHQNLATKLFKSLLQSGIGIVCFLILCIFLLSIFQPQEVRSRLLARNIVLVTPGVLFRKFIKTFIFAVSFFIFLLSVIILFRLLPPLALFAPEFITRGFAFGLACIILGGLMDMQEFLYIAVMRCIGCLEPPENNEEENKEGEQGLFFVGGNYGSVTRRYTAGR